LDGLQQRRHLAVWWDGGVDCGIYHLGFGSRFMVGEEEDGWGIEGWITTKLILDRDSGSYGEKGHYYLRLELGLGWVWAGGRIN